MPRGRRGLIAAAALGAALAGLSLPRAGLWAFGWIGLAPFFLAAGEARSRRGAAAAGFAAGFAFHGVVLNWIYATCRFARIPVPVSLLAWAALCAALALNWALVAFVGSELGRRAPRALRPWIWAVVWTGVAAATGAWTPRLTADLLAYTQWPNLALIQAGSWGGPHLLGFAVVLVNAALAEAWLDAAAGSAGPARWPLAAALALVAGLWIHGESALSARPAERGATARVEILQPVIDQYRKWDAAFVGEIVAGFDELLARPGPAPAVVVWPETSIPRWVARGDAPPEAARWAAAQKSTHLVGVVVSPQDAGGPTNGVQLVAPDGRVAGFYAKREIVPFGEYVPFRGLIPRFVIDNWLQILDNFGDMTPGAARQPLFDTPFGPTAVTICYEAMFPRWARLDSARGARILINVTNDGWYKNTWGPSQHFQANVFRAVENRIPVIRSGNTGVSAVIDPWGVITAELALGERGRLDADVPLSDAFPARSFYSRNGDWFGMLCLILTLLALLRRAIVGNGELTPE
ncbi:MAG: apolipoprotein N-acyltransferase [Elusimicrobiota bacterium]